MKTKQKNNMHGSLSRVYDDAWKQRNIMEENHCR